jgi:hypothetical protein
MNVYDRKQGYEKGDEENWEKHGGMGSLLFVKSFGGDNNWIQVR